MLNKRLVVWILVISFVASLFVGVNADSFSMVRVTYNGFVAVSGNVVKVYRNGQQIFSVVVEDAPKDVAADGQWLYVLYRDGQMKKWNMMNGSSLELGGGWIGIYTTLNGIVGVQSEGLADQELYPPYCRYRFLNLTIGRNLGIAKAICNSRVEYIGESGGTVYIRMSHFYISPTGFVDEGEEYFVVAKDGGVEPLYVKLNSTDEAIEHIWEDVCIVRERLFRSVGRWNGLGCIDPKPESRMLIWEGFGLYLDFMGNLKDWHTNETVATGVGGIVDAAGGEVLYAGGSLGYSTAHALNVPDIVGEEWSGDVEGTGVDIAVVSPNMAKMRISEGEEVIDGWLTVNAVLDEGGNRADGSGIYHRLFGVISDGVGRRGAYGVYAETGLSLDQVRYVSITKLSLNGGVMRVEDFKETGTLTITEPDVPEAENPPDVTSVTTPPLMLADVFLPSAPNPKVIERYRILSSMSVHPADMINIAALDLSVGAGNHELIVRTPIVVGSPWGSAGHSWDNANLGIDVPVYLGYSFQASGKTLKKALDWICSEWGTPVLFAGSATIPIACNGGEVKSPRVVVETIGIEFDHSDRLGYWDKASVNSGLGGNGKVTWGFVTDEGPKFPDRVLWSLSTNLGEIGIVIERLMDLGEQVIAPALLNKWPIMVGIQELFASVVSFGVVEFIKKAVTTALDGRILWIGARRVQIIRGGEYCPGRVRDFLDAEVDPYAEWRVPDSDADTKVLEFLGYKRFLQYESHQALPFKGIFRWGDWILKVYLEDEALQELRDAIANDEDLNEDVKAWLLYILQNVEHFGWVVGFKVFATLSSLPFTEVGIINDLREIVVDMRIDYVAHIDVYSPGEEQGEYRVHRITVGMPQVDVMSEKLVVDVDPINDLSYAASSATVAQELGGVYTLRDETIWNLRGPGELHWFLTFPEKNDQLIRVLPYGSDGIFEVRPGFGSDSMNIEPKASVFWGSGESLNAEVKVSLTGRYSIGDCSYGPCIYTYFDWWSVGEHTASNVMVSNVDKIWDDYSVDCYGTCVLGIWPGEVIAKDFGSPPAWFLVNIGVGYSNIEVQEAKVVGYERVVVYRDPYDEWHVMILPQDVEQLWRYGSGEGADRGFIYNAPDGLGFMFSANAGDICQLPGRVLYANGDDDIWVYQAGQIRHIAANYAPGTCSYTELGDEPGWLAGEDWTSYRFVGIVDKMSAKYVVAIGDSTLEMRSLEDGGVVATATVPAYVNDIRRVTFSKVGGNYSVVDQPQRGQEVGYLWVIWGDTEAVGEEAKPYDRHLRNAEVYVLEFPNAFTDMFELKSVYIYPTEGVSFVAVKYRGKYYQTFYYVEEGGIFW